MFWRIGTLKKIPPVAPPATQAKQACLAGVAGAVSWSFIFKKLMFYTYILQSQKDKKFYIGFSENLKQRFIEHSNGLVDATKNRWPLELVYYEACLDKQSALKREKYFKTGFGRRFLKNRLKLKILPEV
ncbi:MAG: GIY-YIG nuclease family protein [Candidatus Paceibacterota bacterium]